MIGHYLTLGFRHLWKYKLHNAISIVGLAVGLICFSICMYIGRYAMSSNRCFSNYSRIAEVQLYDSALAYYLYGVPLTMAQKLKEAALSEVEVVTFVGHSRTRSFRLDSSDAAWTMHYTLNRLEVDSSFATVFTPNIIAGSWHTAATTPTSMVLSREAAVRVFGSVTDALGKSLVLERPTSYPADARVIPHDLTYTVQAIMDDIPTNNNLSMFAAIDVLLLANDGPLEAPSDAMDGHAYLLLPPAVTPASLSQLFTERGYVSLGYSHDTRSYPMVVTHINYSVDHVLKYFAWFMGMIGSLVWLIGLINFFHFLIGSFLNRSREFSLLKLAGGSAVRLFLLLFTQTLMVLLATGLLALWGIEVLGGINIGFADGYSVSIQPHLLSVQLLQYLLLLIVICGMVCGVVALRIHSISVQTGIFGGNRRQGKHRLRSFMLGVQLFISWIFVSLAVAIFTQSRVNEQEILHTLTLKEKATILSISLDKPSLNQIDKLALVERFRSLSGVQDVLLGSTNYLWGTSGGGMRREKGNDEILYGTTLSVPPNFFSFMNIPIEEGQGLLAEGQLIADRVWSNRESGEAGTVIGTPFYDGYRSFTVVGVCPPYQTEPHNRYKNGYVFTLYNPALYIEHCYLKCHPSQFKQVKHEVERIINEMIPADIPQQYRCNTLLDDIKSMMDLERKMTPLILLLGVVCIIVTLMGIYSAIILDTEHRRKEVAIRKVNGARVPQILMLFVRLYLILLVVSAALAFPLVIIFVHLVGMNFAYFFQPGVGFWSGIFLGITLFTLGTIIFRIWRIARINPAETINKP